MYNYGSSRADGITEGPGFEMYGISAGNNDRVGGGGTRTIRKWAIRNAGRRIGYVPMWYVYRGRIRSVRLMGRERSDLAVTKPKVRQDT